MASNGHPQGDVKPHPNNITTTTDPEQQPHEQQQQEEQEQPQPQLQPTSPDNSLRAYFHEWHDYSLASRKGQCCRRGPFASPAALAAALMNPDVLVDVDHRHDYSHQSCRHSRRLIVIHGLQRSMIDTVFPPPPSSPCFFPSSSSSSAASASPSPLSSPPSPPSPSPSPPFTPTTPNPDLYKLLYSPSPPSLSPPAAASPSPPPSPPPTAALPAPAPAPLPAGPPAINIDRAFIDCLAARRAYRPTSGLGDRVYKRRIWRHPDPKRPWQEWLRLPWGGYVWEYPEVVELEMMEEEGEGEGEVGGAAVVTVVVVVPGGRDGEVGVAPMVRVLPRHSGPGEVGEAGKKLGVVFCRVGLWVEEKGSVLFLDRGVWGEEETGSLEGAILEALRDGWEPGAQLAGLVAEAAYDRWLELFDFLGPQSQVMFEKTAACYSQMMHSLELNAEILDDVDWGKLLGRIQRRVDLVAAMRDKPPTSPPAASRTTTDDTFDVL
ncbi:hypothetical protein C8A00DRAFT_32938 [Chaetomidium leptoderma]|uniref:Uncharacterized protein n=1 Tax=Chaetomidium leptoderma TaxID=669021 RepID=A0AAN6VQ05_9PEZI|nr:hypothetical protein C8A00DRAFT_32938 [Chaetomidium leptoderma]